MTLRRLELLLREARLSSNTQDIDSISDELLVYYSNRVQSMIEDRIFISNSANNIFMSQSLVSPVYGQTEYDLPFDIYAVNAIKSVFVSQDGNRGSKLPFISESENSWGYSLKEGKIVLSKNLAQTIAVNYVRKIPTLGLRFGSAIMPSGVAGTILIGPTNEYLWELSDFFSTVDRDGVIKSRGNRFFSHDKATGVLAYEAGEGTVSDGDYVIPGEYSTSHSQIPREGERIFLEVLERRIAQRQSQSDMNVINPLTESEIALIDSVFAKGTDDNEVPPIVDFSEWT
jgi:hypothetical protein